MVRIGLDDAVPAVCRGGVVCIGNFEAVHRGHQELLQRAAAQAQVVGTHAVALTFDPPPHEVLHPGSHRPPLTLLADRARLLHASGAAQVIVWKTSPALLAMTPRQFFECILLERLQVRGVVEGANFRFGRDRSGDVRLLRSLCEQHGVAFEEVPPLLHDGEPISSSRVRAALLAGQVHQGAQLLGRPYHLRGRVGTGSRRGRELGFPTANLADVANLIPAEGVYAVRVGVVGGLAGKPVSSVAGGVASGEKGGDTSHVLGNLSGGDGAGAAASGHAATPTIWAGAAHIGPNPTFAEWEGKVEVHLIGFVGELYGQELLVEFVERLRGTCRFDSPAALQAQLQADVTQARWAVAAAGPSVIPLLAASSGAEPA